MITKRHHPPTVSVLLAVVTALVAAAAIAFSLIDEPAPVRSPGNNGARPGSDGSASLAVPATSAPSPSVPDPASPAPSPPGPVFNVTLTDSGGPMGEGNGPMHPRAMGLKIDHATVPHGRVTFRVTNAGTVSHEMVILPLPASQGVGTRPFDSEAKVDESGSLGEASSSGGEGAGEGILPGASGRLTVTLAPGSYELVCNLMGHYVSGMFTKLTVT